MLETAGPDAEASVERAREGLVATRIPRGTVVLPGSGRPPAARGAPPAPPPRFASAKTRGVVVHSVGYIHPMPLAPGAKHARAFRRAPRAGTTRGAPRMIAIEWRPNEAGCAKF